MDLLKRRTLDACLIALATFALPTAAIAGSCSSISVPPLNFGSNIVPGAGFTINSSTTISVNCASGTTFTLYLDAGAHVSGSGLSAQRQLFGTGGFMQYGLFQDGARTTTWGDGTTAGTGQAGFGSGSVQPFLIYATLTVPSSIAIGSYSDSVTVTVAF